MSRKLEFLPALKSTLKASLQEIYRSMSFTALNSILWFLVNLPCFILGFFVVQFLKKGLNGVLQPIEVLQLVGLTLLMIAIWNGLVVGPLVTALYGLAKKREEDYLNVKLFFQLLKKSYLRAMVIYTSYSCFLVMLALNIGIAIIKNHLFFTIIAIFSAYAIFVLFLCSYYFTPLLYLGNGFRKVWRKSLILFLDNLGLTLIYGLIIVLIFVLSLMVFVLMPLVFGAVLIYLLQYGFQPIYDRYD